MANQPNQEVLHQMETARTTRIRFGPYSLLTPGYMPSLSSPEDAEVLLRAPIHTPELSGLVLTQPKASKTIAAAKRHDRETTVRSGARWQDLTARAPLLVDPVPEIFYLKRPRLREHIASLPGAPANFFSHLMEGNTKDHMHGWRAALSSGDYAGMVDWQRREQTVWGCAVTTPMTPYIDGQHPETLTLALQANAMAWRILDPLGARPAHNFTIGRVAFNDSSAGEELFNSLNDSIPKQRPAALIFRICGLPDAEKDDSTPVLDNFRLFLQSMGALGDRYKVPLVLLNGGTYGLAAMQHGFDMFSEPMNGSLADIPDLQDPEKETKIPKENLFGKVYHIDEKLNFSHVRFLEAYAAGEMFPAVPHTTTPPPDLDNSLEFRKMAKHYRVAARCEEAKQMKDSIVKDDARGLAHAFSRSRARNVEKLLRNPM